MSEAEAGAGGSFSKGRLEAFSDGVIAVIVTLMVLDLKAPETDGLEDLAKVLPSFLAYVVSFVFAALYWINHHELIAHARRITTGLLWSNNLLLFCLSLFPFSTAYMASTKAGVIATALYGAVQFACGLSFAILAKIIVRQYSGEAEYARRHRALALKNWTCSVLYAAAVGAAFITPVLSIAIFAAIAALYISPRFLVVKES